MGDRSGEGRAYSNLGNALDSLGNFKTAIDYHDRHLKIAKELNDRSGEGKAYGNLGKAHDSLRHLKKAYEYHERTMSVT